MKGSGPPRLAERIAEKLLKRPFRDTVLGDWREEYLEMAARKGRLRASLWYWRQLFSPGILRLNKEGRGLDGGGLPYSGRSSTMGPNLPHPREILRSLMRAPAWFSVAVVVLGLGIASTTAIASAVRAVLVEPIAFDPADRVAVFWSGGDWSLAEFDFARERASAFEAVAAYAMPARRLITESGVSELVNVASVTGSFFDVFEAEALVGRTIHVSDELHGSEPVAVLGHGYWARQFGEDPATVGSFVVLDGIAHRIVGVAPPGFWYPSEDVDIWAAVQIEAGSDLYRFNHFFHVAGRLPPRVSLDAIQGQMVELGAAMHGHFQYREEFSKANDAHAVSLHERIVGGSRDRLLLLLGAAGLLLLISCANVAGMQINRTLRRLPELSIKQSLGASRPRVVLEKLLESVVVAGAGGLVALPLTALAVTGLVAVLPPSTPRLAAVEIDGLALLTGLGVALLSAVFVGVGPALLVSRSGHHVRPQEGRSTEPPGPGGLRRSLVIIQTALSVVLVVGAGLLARSLAELLEIDPGFAPHGVTTLQVTAPSEYPGPVRATIFSTLLDRLGAVPGITEVGAGQMLPLSPGWNLRIEAEESGAGDVPGAVPWRGVSPGFFNTLGISLLRGRAIESGDGEGSTRVAVVNQRLADTYWPGLDPIGRRLRATIPGSEWLTVVGVVGDSRVTGLTDDIVATVYRAYAQFPNSSAIYAVLRSDDPIAPANLRAYVNEVDPQLAVSNIETMEARVAGAMQQQRGLAVLMSVLAAVSLVLGIVGLFGVVWQIAARRTREIGLRLTLGSGRAAAAGLVLREGLVLGLLGIGAGLVVALALTRVLEGVLYGVTTTDPVTLLAVVGSLLLATVLATGLPALRASRIDPVDALRVD